MEVDEEVSAHTLGWSELWVISHKYVSMRCNAKHPGAATPYVETVQRKSLCLPSL